MLQQINERRRTTARRYRIRPFKGFILTLRGLGERFWSSAGGSRLRVVRGCCICALIVGASSLSVCADTEGVPWTGQSGITETVPQIAARQEQALVSGDRVPHPIKPLLRLNRRGLPQHPKATESLAVNGETKRSFGGPFTPQTLGTSFTGSTLADKTLAPPDTMGAAGPSQFIVAVNNRFRSFNKATGTADGALDVDPDVFFASVKTPVSGSVIGNFTSDPHIRYDRLSGRWIIVMIDVPYTSASPFVTAPNRVMIAVSSGPTITSQASFTFFQFQHDLVGTTPNSDTGGLADYPTPGIDANALYVGVNVFNAAGTAYVDSSGFVVRKSSILGAGPIVVTAFRGLVPNASSDGPYTPQGVDNYDPLATEGYFIGVSATLFGELVVRRVSTPGGTPTISANILLPVNATAYPISVPNLGGTTPLDPVDDRLFAAHIRNGRLWTAHNIGVNNTGVPKQHPPNQTDRTASRWYEVTNLTATPAVAQSGTVFDSAASNPKFCWIPSIMVSGQGHAAMGFSTAGANNRANAGTVGRLSSDASGTMQTPVDYTASSTSYNLSDGANPHRWGDYSYTSLDPSDDMTMWTIQEFCNATDSYGVRVVRLLAPLPATPASCSPSSVAAGQANVNVTVTGTQVSGSGFFDPGTGFSNRLAAAVNGGGVTVNSVTYSSPTAITVNITVSTGAATGARTVAVTNPDGQSATSSSGILTITAPPATVVGRKAFYNNSAWDGNNSAANASDDNAIASDKTALLPGGIAAFANYTSYSRGLNGIMVDVANLPGTPTLGDFTFKVGNDNNPAGWSAASAPVSVTPRSLGGGVTRLSLIWNDNNLDATADANEAVAGRWLQVTVKATANTGLAVDDVFYFGNAPGECGNSGTDAIVDTTDVLLPFNNQTAGGAATLTSPYDINRDQSVDTTDVLLPFNHQTGLGTALLLIDLSASLLSGGSQTNAQTEPVPMSLQQLSGLFAGTWPGTNSETNGPGTNRIGRLTVERIGPDQFQVRLAETQRSWQLQVNDDPLHSPWRNVEMMPRLTAEGPVWLIRIDSRAAVQFFRAAALSASTNNP